MEHTTNNERANESIGRSMGRYEARRQPTTNTTSSQLFTGSIENAVRWVSGNHFAHLLTRVGGWVVGWDGALFFSVSQKLALSVAEISMLTSWHFSLHVVPSWRNWATPVGENATSIFLHREPAPTIIERQTTTDRRRSLWHLSIGNIIQLLRHILVVVHHHTCRVSYRIRN